MTGPEHYMESERLLTAAADLMEKHTPKVSTEADRDALVDGTGHLVALAQVHATLALSAATAQSGGLTEPALGGFDIPRYPAWKRALESRAGGAS